MKTAPYSEHRRLSSPRLKPLSHGYASLRVQGVRRGSALITAIVFALIVAITLAGVGTLTVSHYSLARTQADSAAALDLAEAGVNFELSQLTKNGGQADPPGSTFQASEKIDPSLSGTFSITCKNMDGTDWTGPTLTLKTVVITSTATVNGARRIVRIQGKPTGTFYTMYSTAPKGAYTQFFGNNTSVTGVCGTDGNFLIDSNLTTRPKITSVVFNGPKAQWAFNQPVSGYDTVKNDKPVPWETVTSIMNRRFPGGASYLSQAPNNDNDMAILTDPANPGGKPQPGIVENKLNPSGNQTVTLVGKPGGANYYLSFIYMTDHSNIVFDNSKGPINIYSLHYNAKTQYLRGGHATQPFTENSANRVTMYASATGDIDILPDANNDEIDMGIYAYDTKPVGPNLASFGGVALDNNVKFKGQVIAKSITVNNNVQVTGQRGYFETPEEFFGFDGAWEELNRNLYLGGGNQ